MEMTKIYALLDKTGAIRYVGKTRKTLSWRLFEHIKEAKKGVKNHKCNWIRSMLKVGLKLDIVLLDVVEGYGCECERKWIARLRHEGARLTNLTDGGDGSQGYRPSKETLVKLHARRHSE